MIRLLTTLFLLILQFAAYGQTRIYQKDYDKFKPGVYKTKSLDSVWRNPKLQIVKPQTRFFVNEITAFIKIENNPVFLFNKINDLGKSKPTGVLAKTSLVQVDTIFYREIYNDTKKEWSLTFNVWYAITINGQQYYTDYKIHDYTTVCEKLEKFEQKFLLISQSTGYDGLYDVGYPDYLFVAILNNKDELIYESKILDFAYGNEFWDDEDAFTKHYTKQGFEFTIKGLLKSFTAVWAGKELKQFNRL